MAGHASIKHQDQAPHSFVREGENCRMCHGTCRRLARTFAQVRTPGQHSSARDIHWVIFSANGASRSGQSADILSRASCAPRRSLPHSLRRRCPGTRQWTANGRLSVAQPRDSGDSCRGLHCSLRTNAVSPTKTSTCSPGLSGPTWIWNQSSHSNYCDDCVIVHFFI